MSSKSPPDSAPVPTLSLDPRSLDTQRGVQSDAGQLVVLTGSNAGRRIPLDGTCAVGRARSSDFQVDDDGLSRRHFEIQRTPAGFIIRDLKSRNGTFVNGARIEQERLNFGDRISVGASTVMLFSRRDPLEERVVQAQKLQILGELAGGITHDFNNLLSALLASTEYLQEHATFTDESLDACVSDIALAARRAIDLTDQLLGFARSSQQQHAGMDFSQLVQDAAQLARRMLPRTIEIEALIEDDLCVRGDRTQLLQVLMNLCVNAADAMGSDGGTLAISARDAAQAELADLPELKLVPHVVLSVSDTGAGMDETTRQRAFEPFFTTKDRGKGTGLGLSTADRVVRSHGGRIDLESEPGRGSTFLVYLPASQDRPPRPTDRQLPPDALDLLVGRTVLLVEDEDVVRSSLARVLVRAGLEVLTAADGLEAIEIATAAVTLDVVLLDLDLPKRSGEQVFAALKQLRTPPYVLISSGYLDDDRLESLREAGVDGFLHKPYGSRELLSRLAEALTQQEESTGPGEVPTPDGLN